MRRLLPALGLLPLALPAPAAAQFGMVESLFSNVSDISFYTSRGGVLPRSSSLHTGSSGLYGFGVELLFEVGAKTRPIPGAVGDTASLRLVEVVVERGAGTADTTWRYEPVPARAAAEETIWSFELAVGYSQVSGFELRDPALQIHGSVRELPAISFYISHELSGFFAGLRTGLMQTSSLHVVEADGTVHSGNAQSFQLGAVVGYALEVGPLYPFLEAGWLHRHFPGVDWSSDVLPPGLPRELRLSGWQLQAGVQLALR